jgi:hypothetical protein
LTTWEKKGPRQKGDREFSTMLRANDAATLRFAYELAIYLLMAPVVQQKSASQVALGRHSAHGEQITANTRQ